MASRKEQKAAARERLRQEMERRKKRARRNRVIGITAGALVLVLAAVTTGIFVQKEREEKAEAEANKNAVPTKIAKDGVSIPVGESDAPVTLTVYEDFRCPACQQFEKAYGKSIDKLVEEGELKVDYHIATIIDANSPGTHGSKIAGNAAVCANEVGEFVPYHKMLFANQPPEQQDGFTTQAVLKLAGSVDGLKDNSEFESCVKQDRYRSWLRKVQSEFDTKFDGRVATPSLLLDGKVMFGGEQEQIAKEMASPAQFEKTVNQRAERKSSEKGNGAGRPVPPRRATTGS